MLPEQDGALRVTGLPLPRISDLAHESDVRLWELSHQASLEEAYMRMTQGAVDYHSTIDQRAGLREQVPPGMMPPQRMRPVPGREPAGLKGTPRRRPRVQPRPDASATARMPQAADQNPRTRRRRRRARRHDHGQGRPIGTPHALRRRSGPWRRPATGGTGPRYASPIPVRRARSRTRARLRSGRRSVPCAPRCGRSA